MELQGALHDAFMFVFHAANYKLSNFSLKKTGQSQTAMLSLYRKKYYIIPKKILKVLI